MGTRTLLAAFLAAVLGCASHTAGHRTRAFPSGDEGPAAPAARAAVGTAVDAAIRAIERVIPYGRPFRVAVVAVKGPGEGESGLGHYVVFRATEQLVAKGVEVLDPGFVQALGEADRARRGGPTGEPPERLAAIYLQIDAALSGAIHDVGDAYELTLRLAEARSGKILETGTARFAKDDETRALVGEKPAAASPLPVHTPALALERQVFVERRNPQGGFEKPGPWDGSPLATGDRIQILIRPAEACSLCVVVFQSDGTMQVLYPEKGSSAEGRPRVGAGEVVKLPPRKGDFWYPLEPPAGTETFYIVAERQPVRTARVVDRCAEATKLAEKAAAEEKRAAALTDAEARAQASKTVSECWQRERLLRAELRADLEGGAREVAYDFRLRQAFASIAAGEPLPDEVRLRNLGAPTPGGPVEVVWEDGPLPLATGRVEGSGRVIESFEIVHR